MLYTAYGKKMRLLVNQIFNDEHSIRCEYEEGNEWLYVSEPSFFKDEVTTKEATDAVFQKCLDQINAATEDKFGKAVAPEYGVERIEWLVENQLSCVNNKLEWNSE